MQSRMDQRPDRYTLKWWEEQFANQAKATRGATHAMNLVLAEIEDLDSTVKDMKKQVDAHAQEIHVANVEIGKLQAEVTLLKETMDKSRDAYSELKKKISGSSTS